MWKAIGREAKCRGRGHIGRKAERRSRAIVSAWQMNCTHAWVGVVSFGALIRSAEVSKSDTSHRRRYLSRLRCPRLAMTKVADWKGDQEKTPNTKEVILSCLVINAQTYLGHLVLRQLEQLLEGTNIHGTRLDLLKRASVNVLAFSLRLD